MMDNNDLFEKLTNEEMMALNEQEIQKAANALYSLYSAYVRAGFSEAQAFLLITNVLRGAIRSNE